jgi:predicted membrane-bound mannosyltransferase
MRFVVFGASGATGRLVVALASGLKSLALWLGKRLSGRCRVTQMLAS